VSYAVVLPYTYQPYFEACRATMKFNPDRVLVVDNRPPHNIGIMRAHNLGVDFMRDSGADWLIIVSAAVRFGEPGGLDFVDLLAEHDDHYVVHGATANVIGGKQQTEVSGGPNGVFGWHLTAFRSTLFDRIGVWDENFSPYGLDDIDLSLRIQKEYRGAPGWNTYPCDVTDTTMAHSINLAGIRAPYPPRNAYFTRKWGRDGADWQNDGYEHPFNDPDKPLSWWPTRDDPLSIWSVEYQNGHSYDD
jgi:hypothetical protein